MVGMPREHVVCYKWVEQFPVATTKDHFDVEIPQYIVNRQVLSYMLRVDRIRCGRSQNCNREAMKIMGMLNPRPKPKKREYYHIFTPYHTGQSFDKLLMNQSHRQRSKLNLAKLREIPNSKQPDGTG